MGHMISVDDTVLLSSVRTKKDGKEWQKDWGLLGEWAVMCQLKSIAVGGGKNLIYSHT